MIREFSDESFARRVSVFVSRLRICIQVHCSVNYTTFSPCSSSDDIQSYSRVDGEQCVFACNGSLVIDNFVYHPSL